MARHVILGRRLAVEEHVDELDATPVAWRSAPPAGPPVLYLHSMPTSSEDWEPFLERLGGVALDLPGFGRSGKGGHLQYTLEAHVQFVTRFLEAFSLEAEVVVGHGWGGAVAVLLAARHPGLVRRLVLIDPLALTAEARYPPLARHLRTPLVGELLMGSVNRRLLRRILCRAAGGPESSWSKGEVERVWARFDQGTQRAILRLLRSLDEDGLARLGLEAQELSLPVLLVWGELDPWLDPGLAGAYAAQLGVADTWRVQGAGHWPWRGRPEVVERVAAFALRI